MSIIASSQRAVSQTPKLVRAIQHTADASSTSTAFEFDNRYNTITINSKRIFRRNSTHAAPTIRSFSIYTRASFHKSKIHHGTPTPTTIVTKRSFSSKSKADFYKTLGVPKSADKATIKKAYFKCAKEHHPDTNKGDNKASEKFKEVTEAYEILSDDKQRELYDNYGHAGVDPNSGFGGGGGGNPFGGGGNPFGDGSFHFEGGGPGQQIDPEDLFDAFFGGGRRRQRGPRRGSDLQMHIQLTFRDAVFGTKRDLDVRYQVRDPATGRVDVKERSVECTIPAGIDTGMNLKLSGQGAEGDPGAPSGDLLVTVIVEEDDYFQRDGVDVHVEVPISVTQAILGGTVDVKTLTGEAEMKIPKGSQVDTKLMMRGKGIPYLRGRGNQKGNQIVHIKIDIPKKITARQEELLREFDAESEKSGRGISGRVADAAGSAFERVFGKSKGKKTDDKDEDSHGKEKDKKAQ